MNRLLVALTVLAIVWLWRPFPAPGADPFVDVIGLQSPRLHGLVRAWHCLGPAVAAVIAWSVVVAAGRVWFTGLRRSRVRGKLPPWPVEPSDAAPAVGGGEVHHPVALREVAAPEWMRPSPASSWTLLGLRPERRRWTASRFGRWRTTAGSI